ncbi:oxidoreductase [Mixta theicola]|uniref:Oxidoreductase n=1 Tax=Mixta theicola TaxID=1458355 RepID=A0A2K1Q591_9GAMM|nr:Gfo/Idh/MocA family oxidoreductase [Mixta theicola]PNS10196.1 oxidoreductase [Mixta theicola]GLR08500.1 oxidoreductase [Mixta theicola]
MTLLQGKIRTAVVGFGVSGQVFHAPLIAADAHFALSVIVTGDAERRTLARQRYPQARLVESWEQLLQLIDAGDVELDLVVLGTPPQGHRAQAEAAIARGLHLVIDKPFVPHSRDGEALIAAAQAAGTLLTVFQNRRWDGDFLTVKKLLSQNALGDIRSFESRFEWWRPQGFGNWRDRAAIAEGGGLLLDLGSHLIDQALQLFGPVADGYAELTRHTQPALSDADEDSFVSLLHVSGVRTRLWMNGLAARQGPRFHLLGSQAGFSKWGLDNQEPALAAGMTPLDAGWGAEEASRWGTLTRNNQDQIIETERGDYPAFYRLLANALLEGTPLPVEAADSLATLRLIEDLHTRYAVRSA